MAGPSYFDASFKAEVKRAVADVERETSGEVVVAVRPVSGNYRHVDLTVGAVAALLALLVFLYHPEPFEFTYLPVELGATFALGTLLSMSLAPVGRWFGSRRRRRDAVELAASAAFTDLGVHATRERTGLLIFVSVFEQELVVRADVDVGQVSKSAEFEAWQAELRQCAFGGGNTDFASTLRKLGPILAAPLPRRTDDENELADGVAEVV